MLTSDFNQTKKLCLPAKERCLTSSSLLVKKSKPRTRCIDQQKFYVTTYAIREALLSLGPLEICSLEFV